jgi:hypothetical protein
MRLCEEVEKRRPKQLVGARKTWSQGWSELPVEMDSIWPRGGRNRYMIHSIQITDCSIISFSLEDIGLIEPCEALLNGYEGNVYKIC